MLTYKAVPLTNANLDTLRGKKVTLMRKSNGEILTGVLDLKNDWLVGCPTVTLENGEVIDIGYYTDLVVPA